MRKLRLYVETSVWSHWFADDAPERRDATREFLRRCRDSSDRFVTYISVFVLDELRDAPGELAAQLEALVEEHRPVMLEPWPDVHELAQSYVELGILPAGKLADRLHVALATAAEMDILVSWNYRHLVNVRRREMINGANQFAGYVRRLEIVTPPEVFEDEIQQATD
jgi:predicted nucleic acid-binding protein